MNLSKFLPLNQISRELSIYINSPTNKKPIKAIHIKELIENYINSYDDIYNIRKEINKKLPCPTNNKKDCLPYTQYPIASSVFKAAQNVIDHANKVYDKTEKLD